MAATSTKVFVYPVLGQASEILKLKKLLIASGCELVCDKAASNEFKKCVDAADVLVVLICAETMDDTSLNALISEARNARKRIVGVWASDSEEGKLPAAINKYGTAAIQMQGKAVRETICGDKTDWQVPSGEPRPTPKTPRHKGKKRQ